MAPVSPTPDPGPSNAPDHAVSEPDAGTTAGAEVAVWLVRGGPGAAAPGTKTAAGRFLAAVNALDQAVDAWWDRRLRGRGGADRVFYAASEAANHSILWHGLGAAAALARRRPGIALRVSGALGVESALVNGLIKSAFRRHRPVPDGPRPHRLRQPRTTSFPSGHASAAMVAAALLAREQTGRWQAAGLYGLAALVAVSRIHVRIHYASDVIGGVAAGAALGAAARRLLR